MGPGAQTGDKVCPTCGWRNAATATSCDFCRMPLERPATRPLPPAVTCPHCGAEGLRLPGQAACRDCGRPLDEPPRAGLSAQAVAVRAARSLHVPFRAVLLVVIAGTGIALFLFWFSAHRRGVTADHVRRLRQMLLIYDGEQGGFPPTLEAVEKRYGPIPDFFRRDGWDRPLVYRASRRRSAGFEGVPPLFEACEVRSAGPNGTLDDGDDVVWAGTSR